MSTRAPHEAHTPRRRRFRIDPDLGAVAGLLSLALIVFSIAGGIWGLLKPTFSVTVGDGGELYLGGEENVEFTAFVTYVIATGLLATMVAVLAYVKIPGMRELWMLLWVGAVSGLAGLSFWAVGDVIPGLVHGSPAGGDPVNADQVVVVPSIDPGVGVLAAPLMGMLTYWLLSIVHPAVAGEESGEAASD